MMVNMAHMQYHLRAPQTEFSCKIFQSALHLDWVIMLTNKSGTNYALNEHEDLDNLYM